MKRKKQIKVSYKDIEDYVVANSKYLEGIDTIVTLSRGGLIFAQLFAYALGVKEIIVLKASSYQDKKKVSVPLIEGVVNTENIAGMNVLLVDDIIDTGDSIRGLKRLVEAMNPRKLVVTAMFIKKSSGINLLDKKGDFTPEEAWIVFPWDKLEK